MKKLFVAFLAVAALAACAKEEIVSLDNGETIQFGNAFVNNITRVDKAADPSLGASDTNKFTSFNVWGTVNGGNGLVSIYEGDVVSGTVGEDSQWTCESVKQYWIAGAYYKFAALANADLTKVTPGSDLLPASVVFVADGSTDLVYAKNFGPNNGGIIGLVENNPSVNMVFEHLLSKVKFSVVNKSTTATGYSFIVENITVNGSTAGTVALPAKTWGSLNTASDIEFTAITVATGDAGEECDAEKLLIPGDVKVSCDVIILCDGTRIGKKEIRNVEKTLAVGFAYNFVVNVAVGEEITFTVEENPKWTENTTNNTIQ